jgi:arsenate reductase
MSGQAKATMYGIRNCDTVKKARAWLDRAGYPYDFHDYKLHGIERARLEAWSAELGWDVLLNRAGTSFRKLPEAQKSALTQAKALDLMLGNPSLIKRPVLDLGKRRLVGFEPQLYEAQLK